MRLTDLLREVLFVIAVAAQRHRRPCNTSKRFWLCLLPSSAVVRSLQLTNKLVLDAHIHYEGHRKILRKTHKTVQAYGRIASTLSSQDSENGRLSCEQKRLSEMPEGE